MKETFAPGHPYLAGETVTPGRFECTSCGHELVIEAGTVTNLPVCPRCQNDSYKPA